MISNPNGRPVIRVGTMREVFEKAQARPPVQYAMSRGYNGSVVVTVNLHDGIPQSFKVETCEHGKV